MPQDEAWSWSKFAKGIFIGKNYSKALVLGFCQLVILCILGALVFTAMNLRGCQGQKDYTKIGTNTGTVNQLDNHATTQITNHYYPLSDVFSWVFGAKQKVIKDSS